MITTTYHSPLGAIALAADARGLTGLWFVDEGRAPAACAEAAVRIDMFTGALSETASLEPAVEDAVAVRPVEDSADEEIAGADAESGSPGLNPKHPANAAAVSVLERAWAWLNAYFAGQAPQWLPPLHLEGDELQHEVWSALLAVPYGETVVCAELAKRVTARGTLCAHAADVAGALAGTPIALVVPLHRVVDASGSAWHSHQGALLSWER